MAGMRVHELAKEFGLSSKDMLDRIRDMKIPAKSHASMLEEAYVDKIRKALEPEVKEVVENGVEKIVVVSEKEAEEKERQAEEERARREAVEKERALREQERARRQRPEGEPKAAPVAPAAKKPPVSASPFSGLEAQIADAKERARREAEEARIRAVSYTHLTLPTICSV